MFGAFTFGEMYYGQSPIGPEFIPQLASIIDIRCGGADTLLCAVGGQDQMDVRTGGTESLAVKGGADVG